MTPTRPSVYLCVLLFCGPGYAAAQMNSSSAAAPATQNTSSDSTTDAQSRHTAMPIRTGQNPFIGGVPSCSVEPGVLPLSLSDAINRGLKYNLGLLLSEQGTRSARGARWQALSHLLPNVSAGVSGTREQINLQALGFPSGFPGIPIIVGPFNVFDARGSLDQAILDLKDLNNERGESENVKAARYTYQDARNLVVLVAANLYLEAVAGSSRVDSSRAEVTTSQ